MATPRTTRDAERDKRHALKQAAHMTQKAAAAEDSKIAAVRFAASCGASLREIQQATGIPHMTVKRIIERGAGQGS